MLEHKDIRKRGVCDKYCDFFHRTRNEAEAQRLLGHRSLFMEMFEPDEEQQRAYLEHLEELYQERTVQEKEEDDRYVEEMKKEGIDLTEFYRAVLYARCGLMKEVLEAKK